MVGKRDPFAPLINDKKDTGSLEHFHRARQAGDCYGAGGRRRALREGMIAVVSNADQHVYFVREGDRFYDGDVEKIGLDGVTFDKTRKTPSGSRSSGK